MNNASLAIAGAFAIGVGVVARAWYKSKKIVKAKPVEVPPEVNINSPAFKPNVFKEAIRQHNEVTDVLEKRMAALKEKDKKDNAARNEQLQQLQQLNEDRKTGKIGSLEFLQKSMEIRGNLKPINLSALQEMGQM